MSFFQFERNEMLARGLGDDSWAYLKALWGLHEVGYLLLFVVRAVAG